MDTQLFNAVVIAENPDAAFIVENGQLHAVEAHVAALKKEKSSPKTLLPLMREAWNALSTFAEGKVSQNFIEMVSLKPDEREQLIDKIEGVYAHLSHHERNALSSLIHHRE